MYGLSIVDHLGDGIFQLSQLMRQAFGEHDDICKSALSYALRMAEQNEALCLIASAYREGIIEEDEDRYFIVRSDDGDYKAFNASSSVCLRYKCPPKNLIGILFVEDGREVELLGVEGVLIALRPFFEKRHTAPTEDTWTRLLHASHQSIRNEAMATVYRKVWDREVEQEITKSGGVFSYLRTSVNAYSFFNQLAAFEARLLTPFSKMKLDMSAKDVLTYSPEFSQDVVIRFAALSKSNARVHLSKGQTDFIGSFNEFFPELYGSWFRKMLSMKFEPNDYYPVPLHPLNYRWVQDQLPDFITEGVLIIVDEVETVAIPTLSFRSMLLGDYCLKLPVPIQTTHMIRNIPIPELDLGPFLSDVLCDIIKAESLHGRLVLEKDLVSVYPDCTAIDCPEDVATMVSFVVRQNPNAQIFEGEYVIPVAGIFTRIPGQDNSFFYYLMFKDGCLTEEQQYGYFRDYIQVIVGTQLELYFKTGLMLEAHQQNLNLVYDQNWILQRLMYHDIPGGVAAYVPLLRFRHNIPEELANSIYYFRDTPDRSILHFVHPTLTAHLMPLAYRMSVELGLDREHLHEIIQQEIQRQIAEGRKLPANSDKEAQARLELIDKFEETVLQNETLPAKRMLERFYLQSMVDNWGTQVPNPEILSERVLVPPCQIPNSLNVSQKQPDR